MDLKDQLLIAIVSAGIALFGVFVATLLAGIQSARDRRDGHVSRLVEVRHQLYEEYVEVLDRNDELVTDDQGISGLDPSQVVEATSRQELKMRLFASRDVLTTAEAYRTCIRDAVTEWNELTRDQKREHRLRVFTARSMLLAAMRADLRIDSLAIGSRVMKRWQFWRLMRAEKESLRQLRKDLPHEEQ